jgi:hypothetical protein
VLAEDGCFVTFGAVAIRDLGRDVHREQHQGRREVSFLISGNCEIELTTALRCRPLNARGEHCHDLNCQTSLLLDHALIDFLRAGKRGKRPDPDGGRSDCD